MNNNVFDGKLLANQLFNDLKKEIKSMGNIHPCFAIIQIGKNSESDLYVKNKFQRAESLGFEIKLYKFDSDVSKREIVKLIKNLNNNQKINGIMVQLPLPKKFNAKRILNKISYKKDIDGLMWKNQRKIKKGKALFVSPTALAVLEILNNRKISLEGKDVVVIGNGIVAGKPISRLLKHEKALVTVLTKKDSKKIASYTLNADIIISAVGKEKLIKKNMINKNQVLIDVGTKINNNVLVGDLDFDNLKENAKLITPTPGGVGPLTVIFLMKNVLKSYKN